MIAEVQGIEVLSLSPWMYGILLLTSVIGLATTMLALIQQWRNRESVVRLEHHINSRLSELLERTATAAQSQGHGEGVEAERKRTEGRKIE